jgi:NAD(P)-dependent dehydrogenase (short-subunit alcohol dehydrogenase family)
MKTILLTGATRGLGLAIARALDEAPDVWLVLAVGEVDRGDAWPIRFEGVPHASSRNDEHQRGREHHEGA